MIAGGHAGLGLITSYEMSCRGTTTIVSVSKAGRVPAGGYEEFLVDNIQDLAIHWDIRADLSETSALWDVFKLCAPYGLAPVAPGPEGPFYQANVMEPKLAKVDAYEFLCELVGCIRGVWEAGHVLGWESLRQVLFFKQQVSDSLSDSEAQLKTTRDSKAAQAEAEKRLANFRSKLNELSQLIALMTGDAQQESRPALNEDMAVPEPLQDRKQVTINIEQDILLKMMSEMQGEGSQDDQDKPRFGGQAAQERAAVVPAVPAPIFETCGKCSGTIERKNSTSPFCEKCVAASVESKKEDFKIRMDKERKEISAAIDMATTGAIRKQDKELWRQEVEAEERRLEEERKAKQEAARLAKEEDDRLAAAEAARLAKEEAERLAAIAKEEVERKRKAELERKRKEEAERKAAEAAEKLRLEEERKAREEADLKSLDDWVCPSGHAMQSFSVEKGFPCDMCDKDAAAGEEFWGCKLMDCRGSRLCSYDICADCKNTRLRRDLRAKGEKV